MSACRSENARTRSGFSASILSNRALMNADTLGFSAPPAAAPCSPRCRRRVAFAEQIQRLGRLLGEADDAVRVLGHWSSLLNPWIQIHGSLDADSDPRPEPGSGTRTAWYPARCDRLTERLRIARAAGIVILRSCGASGLLAMICSLVLAADVQAQQRQRPTRASRRRPPPLEDGAGRRSSVRRRSAPASRPARLLLRARGTRSGGGCAGDDSAAHRPGDAAVRPAQPAHVFGGRHARGPRLREYTAVIGVLTLKGELLSRGAVQSEFRTARRSVRSHLRRRGPGRREGGRADRPRGGVGHDSRPASIEVSLLGEVLDAMTAAGRETATPGRPVAIVSNVRVEYRPAPRAAKR